MNSEDYIYRDGTSQTGRHLKALDPDYVSVEERTTEDWIRFTKELSGYVRFFNEQNQEDGDWSAFFDVDPHELARFLEDPESFCDDEQKLKKFRQPHLVLFLIFLELLRYPQKQFRDLTKRHLDFYYREVLKFKSKPGIPDKVHVILEPSTGTETWHLKKGRLLDAGKDNIGNPLAYAVDEDIIINKAQVADIKTVTVQKTLLSVSEIFDLYDDPHTGFERVFRRLLGHPRKDDPLPPVVSGEDEDSEQIPVDLDYLLLVHEQFKTPGSQGPDPEIQSYILDKLCFASLHDFNNCLDICGRAVKSWQGVSGVQAPDQAEIEYAFGLVEKAYKKGINLKWRVTLKEKHEYLLITKDPDTALTDLFQYALGHPEPDDSLPHMPGMCKTLADLYAHMDEPAVAEYIKDDLCMSVSDFQTIMQIVSNPGQDTDPGELYRLLLKAQVKKRGFSYPSASRQEIEKLTSATVAKAGEDKKLKPERFRTFTNASSLTGDQPVLGFAIASPIFFLKEGQRSITLTLACNTESFNPDRLAELFKKDKLPFEVSFSSGKTSVTPDELHVCLSDVGFIEDPLETYDSTAFDPIDADNLVLRSQRITFDNNDLNCLLVFRDGSIYRVEKNLDPGEVQLAVVKKSGSVRKFKPVTDLRLTSFCFDDPAETYTDTGFTIESGRCSTDKACFSPSDENGYLVFPDSRIYMIAEYADECTVNLVQMENDCAKFSHDALIRDALVFNMHLGTDAPAILPSDPGIVSNDPKSEYPLLKVVLKDLSGDDASGNTDAEISCYELFRRIALEKIHIQVDVRGARELKIRSDSSILNPKTPFLPFDSDPRVGNGFYFGNSEICSKKLDALELNLEWMGLPDNFNEHYLAYSQSGFCPGIQNDSFKTQLKFYCNRVLTDIGTPKNLFGSYPAKPVEIRFGEGSFILEGYHMLPDPGDDEETEDPLDMPRYFKLELQDPDFQHDVYSLVLNKVSMEQALRISQAPGAGTDSKGVAIETVYPPYTPKLKTISMNYSACVAISLRHPGHETHRVFQLHPFGYTDTRENVHKNENNISEYRLMPQYTDQGYLYIGLADLKTPQTISLLFQMIPSSGNPELESPEIKWSYLAGNSWKRFLRTEILADSTNNLLDTGLIRFAVPEEANDCHDLMPDNLVWVRAAVEKNGAAVPETLDIKAQAVSATFQDRDNSPDHLAKPLKANSVEEFCERDPAIKSISQPYTSFDGRMPETGMAFYTRVSERLRHKGRALSTWDYQRLVLEKFPQIFNVKCLNQADFAQWPDLFDPARARVMVVVVPDIADTEPFFPLEPRAPLYLLQEIESYLKRLISPFVDLKVKNPRYERIKYRVAVRFKPGYDQGYYLRQLNQEIMEFLSPWAFRKFAEIPFCSTIHNSQVIHFIEKREYVDYVAKLKLIEQVTEEQGGTTYKVNLENLARVHSPDSILVSARDHIIDPITTEGYEEEDFDGIGYMIIEIDFVVRKTPEKVYPADPDIGKMWVGENFTVFDEPADDTLSDGKLPNMTVGKDFNIE